MSRKPGVFLFNSMLLLIILSLFPLLTTPVSAGEVTWDISHQETESFTTDFSIGGGVTIPLPISLSASGAIQVISPTNVVSSVTIPVIDSSGFSHTFPMPETGKYVIRETYTLVFSSLYIIPIVKSFNNTDEWEYNNSTPSLMSFRLEDMYVDNY